MLLLLGSQVQTAAHASGHGLTLEAVDKLVGIAAVLFGAFWTYLNYVRGRTHKRRLEPTIVGKLAPGVAGQALVVSGSVSLKNVGLSKVDIGKEGTAIVIRDLVPGVNDNGQPAMVERRIPGGVLSVFTKHRWIEPGETIAESFSLPVAESADRAAVRLALRIVSRHRFFKDIEWNADSIADLSDSTANKKPGRTDLHAD